MWLELEAVTAPAERTGYCNRLPGDTDAINPAALARAREPEPAPAPQPCARLERTPAGASPTTEEASRPTTRPTPTETIVATVLTDAVTPRPGR
jgi:hypothetical protein